MYIAITKDNASIAVNKFSRILDVGRVCAQLCRGEERAGDRLGKKNGGWLNPRRTCLVRNMVASTSLAHLSIVVDAAIAVDEARIHTFGGLNISHALRDNG